MVTTVQDVAGHSLGCIQSILDCLLAGSFAELSPWKLRVSWTAESGAFMSFVRGGEVSPHITVDPWLASAPEGVLRGALAHELGHAEIARRRGLIDPDLKGRLESDEPDWHLMRRVALGVLADRVHRLGQGLIDRDCRGFALATGWQGAPRRALSALAWRSGWLLASLEERAATRIAIEHGFEREVLEAGDYLQAAGFDPVLLWGVRRRGIVRLVEP
jgi:hypothetical protein